MEFLVEQMEVILGVIITLTSAIIATTSFVKALRSERRTKAEMTALAEMVVAKLATIDKDVAITRLGIVQAFKDAVVTKDIKVSINSQVKKVLDEYLGNITEVVQKSEESRTQMTYWALKILRYTAAYNKLTVEQQTELDEIMALIADDEKIIDTLV